tara:strand:+ start:1855 stop:2877 length:1023 start_codon:yes stop_codon:yes gene_type:complete
MSNIKTVLGVSIDLDSYNPPYGIQWFEDHYPNSNFLGFGWRNIEDDVDNDYNKGVRAKGTPNAEGTLGQGFLVDGWKMDYLPPIEDQEGNLLDGRTRRQELQRLGEKWMPVARLKIKVSDTPNSSSRATSIRLNNHDYHQGKITDDFVSAVVADINDGECKPTEDDVWYHLTHVYNIEDYYDNSKSGVITKIVNEILKQSKGGTINIQMQRSEVQAWLDKVKTPLIPTSAAILKTGGSRDEQLITRWVLPQAGKRPELVLYTDGYFEEDSKESVKTFIKDVRKHFRNIFKTVGEYKESVFKLPEEECFNLLGIVPTHDTEYHKKAWKERRLLTLEEFLNN